MSNNELFRHLPIEQRVTTPRFVVTGHNPDGKGRLVRVNEPRSDHHYLPGRLCGFKSEKKMKPGVGNEKVYKFFVDVLGFEGKFLGLDERSFTYLPEYVGGNTPYDVGELMVVREHGGIRLCKVEGVYAYGKVIEYSVRMVELKEVNGTIPLLELNTRRESCTTICLGHFTLGKSHGRHRQKGNALKLQRFG